MRPVPGTVRTQGKPRGNVPAACPSEPRGRGRARDRGAPHVRRAVPLLRAARRRGDGHELLHRGRGLRAVRVDALLVRLHGVRPRTGDEPGWPADVGGPPRRIDTDVRSRRLRGSRGRRGLPHLLGGLPRQRLVHRGERAARALPVGQRDRHRPRAEQHRPDYRGGRSVHRFLACRGGRREHRLEGVDRLGLERPALLAHRRR